MSIETKLLLGLLAIPLAGLLALGFVRLHVEAVSFDTVNGGLRLERFLLGFPYGREDIPSGLEWMGDLIGGPGAERWIRTYERHGGSLFLGTRHRRRIGQLYHDACTLAYVLHGRDSERLRQVLLDIAAADAERIQPLRQELRAAFDRQRLGR